MFNSKKYLPFLLALVIGLSFTAFAKGNATSEEMENIQVRVRTGDTVWEIAENFKHKDEDIRAVVARIYQANDLAGKVIKPGDELLVPVQKQVKDSLLAQLDN